MGLLGLLRKSGAQAPVPEIRKETEEVRESQCKLILQVLREGVSLTQSDAIYLFDCFRLGARIWELRHKDGYPIRKDTVTHPVTGKRYAQYSM